LSEQQLDARRRGLEQYLEKVCAVRVIAESDAMQEFLTDRLEEDGDQGPAVDLKVLLPDREVVTVTVPKAALVKDVYDAVCSRVGLDAETAKYFYLFEIVEYNFGKLKMIVQEHICKHVIVTWMNEWNLECHLICDFTILQNGSCNLTNTRILYTFRTTRPPVRRV